MKRVAEEAITKEHGSTPNEGAVQSQSKQMATAAQRASRKIAPLRKSRAPQGSRSTTPTAPSVFDQQQQQSSFTAPAPSFLFSLNTNNSFSPPTQSSFDFGGPTSTTSASSFTFTGAQDTQPQNNPFANANGSIGGLNQHDNTMMTDTPSNPPFASAGFQFGSSAPSNPQSTASTNGFTFGQPAQGQTTTGGFGNNLFGQQKQSQESTPNPNPFAAFSKSNQQNGIPTTGASSFGQSSQPGTAAPSNPPLFAFGTSSTTAPVSAPQPAPLFQFGATNTTQPTTAQSPQANLFSSGFSFGNKPSQPEPPATKPIFSFGQPAAPSLSPQPEAAPSPKPNPTLFAPQNTNTTSGMAEEQQSAPVNPFGSLFGAKPVSAPSDESVKSFGSQFKFGEASAFQPPPKPSDSTSNATEPAAQQSIPEPSKPLFSFGQSNTSNGGNFFSQKSATPSSTTPVNNLFNVNQTAPSAEPSEQVKDTTSNKGPTSTTPSSFFNSFGQKAQQQPSSQSFSQTTSSSNSNSFGGFGQQPIQSAPKASDQTSSEEGSVSKRRVMFQSPAEPDTSEEGPAPKKRALFQTSSPAAMAQAAFGSFQPTTSAIDASKSYATPPSIPQESTTTKEPLTRAVSTEGAPQIPRHLSGDKYKSYDENYRLRNLNRLFRDKISQVDVDKFDVMSLIQNYLDHREAIGEGLGRYGRVKAGLKRRADDLDDLEDDKETERKKSKSTAAAPLPATEPPSSSKTSAPSVPSSSGFFSSVTSPKASNTFSPSKPATDSNTPSLFRSMIPSASDGGGASSNLFSKAATKSTTPPSSPPKSTAPQMPKFELPKSGGAGNFMDAFAKASAENAKKFEKEAREKRKAEEFDSDEEDEEAWNKRYEEEQRAKKAKIEAAAKGGFVPRFGATTSQSTSSNTKPNTALAAKPLQTFNPSRESSQDPIATIEGTGVTDESEGSGSGNSGDDEEEPVTDDLAEDEVEENNEDQDINDEEEEEIEEDDDEDGEPIPQLDPSQSLFSRISRDKPKELSARQEQPILQPSTNNSFKPGLMFGNIGKSTPDAPAFSPLTPATNPLPKGDFKPATTFHFTPTPSSAPGKTWNTSSVLTGGAVRDGPIPGEGLFGSRPSTPQPQGENDSKSTSVFGMSKGTPSDNTWKRGSEIRFGTSPLRNENAAPVVEVTSATPPPKDPSKPFAGLFGQPAGHSASTNGNSNSLGFNFGNGLTSAASNPVAPGFLSAAPHLGNSIPGSGISSRATSPGLTDNESVATDNTEDYSNEPQAPSLLNANAGEEDETVLSDAKAHIYRQYSEKDLVELDALKQKGIGRGRERMTAGLNQKGTGVVKLLKHKDTNKCRILFRSEPGANIILNVRLLPTANYTSIPSGKTNGALQFLAVGEDGKMQSWMLKVKTKVTSDELATLMNENKKN